MARILVIDDDPGVRSVLLSMLTRKGHTVRCEGDGESGLAAFARERPDLVITDIIMPKKEGIETIQSIRRAAPDMPIIAISGGGRVANADFLPLATKFGATAVIAKPFASAVLLDAIQSALAARPAEPGANG